jgi:hypothetical protein
MSESESTLALVALFALRCIMPLVITLAFGYFMNRLVDRWHQEDVAAGASITEGEPSSSRRPSGMLPAVTIPCWILKNCDETKFVDCAAYKQPGIPCWMARLRSDGALPADCPNCPIYAKAMVPALS